MFIVTGSGRSGTSAVARLLHEAGIPVGNELIQADQFNAEGYFEERPVIELNERLLADVGLHEWFSIASRDQILEAARARHEAMRALVAGATPAWKDPRFSWTLEAWLEVLPEPPRVIVCLRSPEEVVASTLRYYGLGDERAYRAVEHLWRAQYERLLDVIADHHLDATCVEYGELQTDTDRAVARLERFAGRKLDARWLRRDLRHHVGGVPAEFAELYARVRSLGESRRSPAAPPAGGGR